MIHRNITRVAYTDPKLVANTDSQAYKDGFATHEGGGWWRGCPYCHDTQDFCDWQAGWHAANNRSTK